MGLPVAAAAVLLGVAQLAQASIASWTFETSAPALTDSMTNGPIAPEEGSGSANGFHASALTDWSNPVGNGTVESWSSNNWAIGDYYEFHVSTLGEFGISIDWEQTRSSTGPADFRLEWSTDGSTFNSLLDYTVDTLSWSSNPASYQAGSELGPVALPGGADNQADLYLRLTATSDPSGTAGTNRIDNVTITPEPATLGLLVFGAIAGLRRRR
jgi:hypothetical protein